MIYVNNLMCCYLSYNYLCDFYYLSEIVEIIVIRLISRVRRGLMKLKEN